MKIFLKLILGILLLVGLVVGTLAAYIQWFDHPEFKTEKVSPLRLSAGNIETGKKIVSNLCVSCHLSKKGDLSGKVLMNHPDWGIISTGNLTHHPESDISKYTDEELFYFLKTGIKPNGRLALPMMPKFATMSDEDLSAVISFMRSNDPWFNPTESTSPKSRASFLLKALMKFEIKPVPFDPAPVVQPQEKGELAYGSYLVNGRYACYECHSRSTANINYLNPIESQGYLGGGSKLLVYGDETGIRSANITPDPEYGIGSWTFEDFEKAITSGTRPDGKQLRPPMNPLILDSIEINSLWKYLQSVTPLSENWEYNERMEIAEE